MIIDFQRTAPSQTRAPLLLWRQLDSDTGASGQGQILSFRSGPKEQRTPDPDYAEFADRIDWLLASSLT